MEIYIPTVIDYGNACDGKARILQVCHTEDEAKNIVKDDIQTWADNHAGQATVVDFDKMSAYIDNGTGEGTEWSICKAEI